MSHEYTTPRSIRITDSAKKRIVSEIVEWSANSESKGADRAAAYLPFKSGMEKVVGSLKEQAIKPEDIMTIVPAVYMMN